MEAVEIHLEKEKSILEEEEVLKRRKGLRKLLVLKANQINLLLKVNGKFESSQVEKGRWRPNWDIEGRDWRDRTEGGGLCHYYLI